MTGFDKIGDGKKVKPAVSNLGPIGTKATGFADGGSFSCMNCIHRTPHSKENGEIIDSCKHPLVMADPELKDRKLPDGTIRVGWDECCAFVRPPTEESEKGE